MDLTFKTETTVKLIGLVLTMYCVNYTQNSLMTNFNVVMSDGTHSESQPRSKFFSDKEFISFLARLNNSTNINATIVAEFVDTFDNTNPSTDVAEAVTRLPVKRENTI